MAVIRIPRVKISRWPKIIGGDMYRNHAYDEDLAKELSDINFAQEYLLSLVEDPDEPMSIEEALRFMIPRMGIPEFAKIVGKSKSDIDKFLRGERNLKPETLSEYLGPFKLRLKIGLEKAA